jgi:cation diffusion facilitator CzcD-associated flavoprotein CzcO
MRLRLGTLVRRVDRADGGWELRLDRGSITAAHTVIATGPDAEPVMPNWPGMAAFGGIVIHAGQFRNVAAMAGLDVLVAGPGNSGVDLLGHLAGSDAGELWLSARSGMNITPLRLGGVPLHPVSVMGRHLPLAWQDANARVVQRLAFGDLTRLGHPGPRWVPSPGQPPMASRSRSMTGRPRAEGRTDHHETRHRPVRRPAGPLHRRHQLRA